LTTAQEKIQSLLRGLFQFDCADLDFGIYRIMNYKREAIERFITDDLPRGVAQELERGALSDLLGMDTCSTRCDSGGIMFNTCGSFFALDDFEE